MGKSLDNLRRENEILRQREEGKGIEQRQRKEDRREKLRLHAENISLKNPKKIKFVKKVAGGIGKGAKDLGKGLLWGLNKAGTQYAKAHESRQPQPKRKRKVRKVKRVKKVKVGSYGDYFGVK